MATRYIIGTYTAPHQGQSGRRVDEFTMYSLGFIHPIAIVRWYSEAAEIARLLADKDKRPYAFMEVGDDRPQIVQPNPPAAPTAPTASTETPDQYDGVPADTGTV